MKNLAAVTSYIAGTLNNKILASKLVEDVERAILERLESPLIFEGYRTERNRKYTYYRIKVRNYFVFYVVLNEGNSRIMEVRRFLYGRRYLSSFLP